MWKPDLSPQRLARRYRAERRFRLYGVAAISLAILTLVLLLGSISFQGYTGFLQTCITLDIRFDEELIDPDGSRTRAALEEANYVTLARNALRELFPEVTSRTEQRSLHGILSDATAYTLQAMVLEDPDLIGTTVPVRLLASDDADTFVKGFIRRDVPEDDRRVSDAEIAWLDALGEQGRLDVAWSATFLGAGDSREPEQAGIAGAVVGSFLTLGVTLLLSFPLGVLAAIYLEEFAPENRWTDLIEVNINNLAAVPSIIFGLLGLAVFLNFFGMPRSAPLVGGVVLALMTLPTVIIASRAALEAVPPSIREAALGVGASRVQVVMHHVLPLAMPGILTGTIIGMARALGETAPLLMIGMVAFIVDIPGGVTDPATVLPVQVYLWADSPERAFVAKTGAATMVLLGFLVAMNALAVILRRRFERRW
jgi:phosphate transport system permease protein